MSTPMPLSDMTDHVLETCLVVDDDDFDRMQIRRAVKRQRPDMQMFEFATLSEARKYLASARADIILLDNRLPDGRGSDFAAELRADTRLDDTPIIVVTGDNLASLSENVTALSKDDLSTKNLGDMIAEFLRSRRVAQSETAARLVAEFGEEMRDTIAPVFSRAIRTLRSARAQISWSGPAAAIADLDRVEEMLLSLSDAMKEQGGKTG